MAEAEMMDCANVAKLALEARKLIAEGKQKIDGIDIESDGRVFRIWANRPNEIAEVTGEALVTFRKHRAEFDRLHPQVPK
jgi:hypothetical protein